MTQQISFSEIEYDAKKKQTRRDVFLAKMETIVPFARLVALIAPHYGSAELILDSSVEARNGG